MLVDPAVSLDLPLTALQTGRAPCVRAGVELLAGLGGIGQDRTIQSMQPARFVDQSDQWWARVCYALALLVELYRALSVEHSPLIRLSPSSRAEDLLALANDDEVTDLIAMRDLAREWLLPALPSGPVITGMTFDGSADLSADADLIAGGVLVDFKASQGGSPRADGTRAASLARTDLDQLLGYAFMDYSDTYHLHTVAIYAVRFGYFAAWPLGSLCEQMAGRPIDVADMRRQFAQVLKLQLLPQRGLATRRVR
jgi:hypothetical protein